MMATTSALLRTHTRMKVNLRTKAIQEDLEEEDEEANVITADINATGRIPVDDQKWWQHIRKYDDGDAAVDVDDYDVEDVDNVEEEVKEQIQ